jgi:exonuclease III
MLIYRVLDEITQAILLIIGGVHQNLGPITKQSDQLLVKTQNVRGMVKAAKKKLIINKCSEIFKENPSTILAFQETHFKENDAQRMAIMAKFKTHNFSYNGYGNKQKGVSIFFSEKFWTEDECLYKSDNGDLV